VGSHSVTFHPKQVNARSQGLTFSVLLCGNSSAFEPVSLECQTGQAYWRSGPVHTGDHGRRLIRRCGRGFTVQKQNSNGPEHAPKYAFRVSKMKKSMRGSASLEDPSQMGGDTHFHTPHPSGHGTLTLPRRDERLS